MHQTAAIVRNHDLQIAIKQCREVVEELRDRAVIAARSSRDRTPSAAELILLEPTMIDGAPRSRSMHDRDPIAARSWPDRGAIVAKIGGFLAVKSGQNHRGIEAASSPSGTAPTTLANRLHDRSNDPRSSDQFPSLKACISLLCSSTFDRFVKAIKQISRKISSSS